MFLDFYNGFVGALTNGNPDDLLIVCLGMVALFYLIWSLGGKCWRPIGCLPMIAAGLIGFMKRCAPG